MNEPISFDVLGLDPLILQAVAEAGYTVPTPIQQQAIPLVLEGRDLMAMAQTGTGKTAAFTLPVLQRLLPHANTSASPARHPIRALVLTPTRELAIQVQESVQTYGKHVPLRSAVVFGGVDIKTQLPDLTKGVEILVATPGRLLDHVESRNLRLNQVQVLILDEADRMLDMGFLPDLKRILSLLPRQRQTLLFSATFSDEIKRLAHDFLQNPVTVEVARRNTAAETVQQSVLMVASDDKRAVLGDIIRSRGARQVLVFTRTKLMAARLARYLERDGISADAIHGDKSQQERLKALEAFKEGRITALVATDVAARGLDIDQLPLVVNYELPPNAEDYVHRIGRTGRAGARGAAISLVDPDEERLLKDIEKLLKREFPRERAGGVARSPESRKPATADRSKNVTTEEEWFYKPYQPSDVAEPPKERLPLRPGKPKKQVAALLGGLKPDSGNVESHSDETQRL
ncbi:MAG: DEAD/DEAH box helicase [Methylophilaceae bacterium]|nr:DEAD/DEAH box helicase [Methylophilaceae bacterium]